MSNYYCIVTCCDQPWVHAGSTIPWPPRLGAAPFQAIHRKDGQALVVSPGVPRRSDLVHVAFAPGSVSQTKIVRMKYDLVLDHVLTISESCGSIPSDEKSLKSPMKRSVAEKLRLVAYQTVLLGELIPLGA